MQDGAGNVLDEFRRGRPETFDDAFQTLFELHQRAVYGWLLQIVRNPAAAEDLTVETFWRIYRAHARFNPAGSFRAWSRTIATHAAQDWLRARRGEEMLPPDLPAPASTDPAVLDEIRRKTTMAFSRLPPKLRIAAVLAVVEELPHREIAAALDISVAAVKVRVFRALRLLRRDLIEQGITP
jgi:RNA polymerase sigma factor (sigma-70 family)